MNSRSTTPWILGLHYLPPSRNSGTAYTSPSKLGYGTSTLLLLSQHRRKVAAPSERWIFTSPQARSSLSSRSEPVPPDLL